jgi:hypothetical protein
MKRERELSLAHAQKCSFLIMEQCCVPMAVEIFRGKHCDFSTYLAKRVRAQSGACAEVQFSDYSTELWSHGSRNCFQESTVISAPILPRELELSLEHELRCSFLIIEHSCGPLALEFVSGKHCDFSKNLDKKRELSLAHAQRCIFLIMEQCSIPLAVEIGPRNTSISAPIVQRERELSLAHAQNCSFLIMEQCFVPWQ